jgi:predicted double-glycine peptidase
MAAPTSPDAAELRLNLGSDGTYQVQVKSWREIPFRTVVRQQYDFSCGSAAVATLLSFHYGRTTPEQQVFTDMWNKGDQEAIRKVGFSMLDIKNYLDGMGYRTEGFRLTPAQLRQAARPGLVILDLKGYKHFVVVKGVVADRVLVGDPMLGLGQYTMKEFQSHWNGIFLAVVSSPLKGRPTFNLTSDWSPWSRAPLTEGPRDFPLTKVTDNLPLVSQLTPQILFDPRNPSGQ